MTHVSEIEVKTDLMKSDADKRKEDTNNADTDNNKTHLNIDDNVMKVHETAHKMPLDYTHTDTYHEHIANKHDDNITALKDSIDVCRTSTAFKMLDSQNKSVLIDKSNIHQDIRPFDNSIGRKGHVTQDPTHTNEHVSKNVNPYTSDEHTHTKTPDEKDTTLLHSPQKEIDEEIPYHTPIIIEHTKDSPCKSSDKSDVQDIFAHKIQDTQEQSHNISHIIEENKISSVQPPFSQREDQDIGSIERKPHDIQTDSVLSVGHKIRTEQDLNPYISMKDPRHKHTDIVYDTHKQTEPTPFNAVKTAGLAEVKSYSSRDPRLQASAERIHTQENNTYRTHTSIEHKTHEQETSLIKQNISRDTIAGCSERHDRLYAVEHKIYDAKDTLNKSDILTQDVDPKTGRTEHVSKDTKDVSTHGHKKPDTPDTVTFKTPTVPEDSYHIGHKLHERDTTYPIHKEHDTHNTIYKGTAHVGHETSTYTTVGHKKHYEDTSPYNVPFGYMGHKDVSSYPSHKPTDISYSGLERKEIDTNYTPIKQIEQYPNIHTEHKKQAKNTTPYHNVTHTGLLDSDPYHAPAAYEPNAYPIGQTSHIEHDPNYQMGHTRHIEHDPYSFGHMGPMDTLYNPFDHYAFDQEAFGYMGHLGDTKHVEQDVRDTGVSYDVGHMDTFQAMEQSRHVLDADTETRTDTQGHETSPTHMLL